MSTQLPLQHAMFEPDGQTRPQPPQFARSVCVLVQTPLHAALPAGHGVHTPPTQTVAVPHAAEQLPQ